MTDDAARHISREGLAALEAERVSSGPASRNAEDGGPQRLTS